MDATYLYKTAGWETTPFVYICRGRFCCCLVATGGGAALLVLCVCAVPQEHVLELSLLREKPAADDFDMFPMIGIEEKKVCVAPFLDRNLQLWQQHKDCSFSHTVHSTTANHILAAAVKPHLSRQHHHAVTGLGMK